MLMFTVIGTIYFTLLFTRLFFGSLIYLLRSNNSSQYVLQNAYRLDQPEGQGDLLHS